jgi:hypothetical protein
VAGGGGGTKDTGDPEVEVNALTFVPNAIVVATLAVTVAGKVADDPEGTDVINVLTVVVSVVFWSEAGQMANAGETQLTAENVSVVDSVVVVSVGESRRALFAFELVVAVEIDVLDAATVEVEAAFLPAQRLANVVYQIGTCVSGLGPQEWVDDPSMTAILAPATAPRASSYDSTSWSSQSSAF